MSLASPPTSGFLRSKTLALGVLSAAGLMTILDGSIVTVALPVLQRELGFTDAGLSWTVNAYLIAFGGLLLLAGRLGDLVGRKRMFLAGTAVFTAASVVAGLSDGPGMLLAARFGQGIGSAMASAVVLGILVTLFTSPGERGKAIAVFSFTGAVGASLGQVLGGVLTDLFAWNWIFLINLPIGLAVLALAVPALPNDRGIGLAKGADVAGSALVTAGLMLAIYTVVGVEQHGWLAGRTLGLGALSAVLLAAFFVRQATAKNPLMPLRILRSRAVAGANIAQMLALSGMFAFQILVALYMQKVLGYGALETGLAMLPAAVAIGAVSLFVSAPLSARFGTRATLLAGLVLLVAAMLWLTRVPVDASYVRDLLPVMVLIAGGGLVLPSLATLGMSGAGADDAGLASGLFNTTQQIGMAFGVAVLSTLAASRTESHLASGTPAPEALTTGYHLAFATSAALLTTAFIVSLLIPRTPEPAPAAESPVATAA
ncbi:EmrB/QacA subfamily drug resistance transporter [Actinocorallia herbida]|uniref:EmrB/QacA subfamily drug resistance transporter n=1 Tax=Actinocorallia herbida TaxID=58109 RepID=A0A3N1CSU7_9ACTN|nr:MFS transporter [Actinocorallia herbida]ROO84380.1 EmrB/QacA subfamily drug resistance transporter [Actinocorallia herbida]